MKKQQIPLKNSLLLLLTATIWGISFVAQSEGGDAVGAFTFNATRNLIGSLVLVPVILLLGRLNPSGKAVSSSSASEGNIFSRNRTLILGGVSCGICLCLASNFQQVGISYTSVGKAGFITACYIVIVPILGLFMKKKMQPVYLDGNCSGTYRALSSLHYRWLFYRQRRYPGTDLCISFFPAYSGN